MYLNADETIARLERFVRARLKPGISRHVCDLTVRAFVVGDGQAEPIAPVAVLADPASIDWRPFPIGSQWGPAWGTCWFEVTGAVPGELRENTDLELIVDLGWLDHSVGFQSEGLVFRPDGTIVKALNPRNAWIPLSRPDGTSETTADGEFRFYIEAAANPLLLEVPPFEPTVLGDKESAGDTPLYRIARADLTVRDEPLAQLVLDLEVCGELAATLPDDSVRRVRLLAAIDDALDVLDDQDLAATIPTARDILHGPLALGAHASAHHLWAVGHAHIDSAWLWPLRETIRKVARTVANQLNLLDRYPQHRYAMSTAQQFAWLEEHYPTLFARVRQYIEAGRFLPVGGMWVESDTNMPSSETMARQFTYGKRYFMERLGVEPREVWLPDSFGYSAALPQLARLAGFDYFLTQKISWNDTNPFPHHTFWWEGLDGSRIFTHFPPADTYGAEVTGRELAYAQANFRDKAYSSHSMLLFGYGDGGGGPTREMLDRINRYSDLEGAPRIQMAAPADFFEVAQSEYDRAPVWSGELYLELHRGTYTSQHATKRGNRRCEALLLEAERAATSAHLCSGADYPYDELEACWRTVLLHQFHDILPGSSIAWVHREAERTYAETEERLHRIVTAAGAELAVAKSAASCGPVPSSERVRTADDPTVSSEGTSYRLTAQAVTAEIDGEGCVTSLRWNGREAIAPGRRAGELELLRDQPTRWDAWDIDRGIQRRPTGNGSVIEVEPYQQPGRAGVRIRRTLGSSSTCEQDLFVTANSPLLQCELTVDWQETERLLRAVFPLDLAPLQAEYETQFGHITRPLPRNTSWQEAQHEVCAQRFVRLVEGEFGVALINDSSYGHCAVRGERAGGGAVTEVRMSLLRAPRFPDPKTDRGRHQLSWALAPAPTALDAITAARKVNEVAAIETPGLPSLDDGSSAVIEAVKLADDRSGDVVVRLYEAAGEATEAILSVPPTLSQPQIADLLERPAPETGTLVEDSRGVRLRLRPFQILTLRFARATRA